MLRNKSTDVIRCRVSDERTFKDLGSYEVLSGSPSIGLLTLLNFSSSCVVPHPQHESEPLDIFLSNCSTSASTLTTRSPI